MSDESDDIEKAVEEVDRIEDEEEAEREKAADEHNEKDEDNVIICPKCKLLVGEADFRMDEFSEMGDVSLMSKINCSNCGYVGLPVEVSRKEYRAYAKKGE